MTREDSRRGRDVLNAGLDEVGMGCWAGPLLVVVAAFRADQEPIEGVDDSKKLTAYKREILAPQIVRAAEFIGMGWVSAKEIDKHKMANAWQMAAKRALVGAPGFSHLYVDGQRAVSSFKGDQSTHEKGESKFWEIAAASVVAKVLRDKEMEHMHEFYPGYGFAQNAGYGTEVHRRYLRSFGPTPIHRMFYLRNFIAKERPPWAE
jgi:ribonuclease HII